MKKLERRMKKLITMVVVLAMLMVMSTAAFATTPTATATATVLTAPSLIATAGDSHISLAWSLVTGATYYNVYQSLDDLTYNLISTPSTVTTATYYVTGLTNGTLYYFKISAANTDVESAYSDVVSNTPSVRTTPVNLGTAGNYAILAKSGISSVPSSVITGNIAVSPIASTAITGFSLTIDATNKFSTSTQVIGKVYAPDYSSPTPSNLTTAVGDMETAYTDAAGRDVNYTELYTGDISGQTLTPGVYKWGTGVLITSDVTLNGGPNDVFIFQIAKGITQATGTQIILSGGAQAKNIFWQSCETVAIGTDAHFEGIVLGKTNITLGTNASINGRLLAQTAVTLIMNTVVEPSASVAPSPSVTTMEQLQAALAAGVTDITIASSIPTGMTTVTIPSGTTLRDYWKIGFGNKIVVNAGGRLRWGTGTTANLLVGNASSTANIALATGATFTIAGAVDDKIAAYVLDGTATVQQQNTNPFVVAANETFTITTGSELKVAAATDTVLANVQPVLSVHATGGKLVVNGTLHLLAGSRIVLSNGLSSIVNAGTITNNAGTYDGSLITGVVGILDANHIPVM